MKAKAIHAGFSECSNLAAQAVCMRARFNMCRYTFVLRGSSDTQCVICRFNNNMLAGIFLCFRLCSDTHCVILDLTCAGIFLC